VKPFPLPRLPAAAVEAVVVVAVVEAAPGEVERPSKQA